MNKFSEIMVLKQLLKEKQDKLDTLKYEYEAIVEQEPYMRNRLKNRQYSIHKLAGEIKSIEKEIKTMESKHLQDSMEILRLSGFTTDSDCGEKVYTKGAEDQCKDGGPGSGIKGHTTSKEPSYTSRSGYNFEEPKVIEAAIKKVKESGHPDPYYLSGLEQALQRSKKERGMKDGGPGSGIKGHTTPKKPSSYYTQRSAAQSRLLSDVDEIKYQYKKEGKTLSHGKLLQELEDYGWDDYELEGLKLPMNLNDDDATEMGSFEQLGQNHETEAMEPSDNPVQAQDDEVGEKFKTVMKEFGKGELKSSSGEKVTDPKQAKAIAYSEQREAKDEISYEERQRLVNLHNYEALKDIVESNMKRYEPSHPEYKRLENLLKKYDIEIKKLSKDAKVKDSDPKVAEANKLISLFGGAM